MRRIWLSLLIFLVIVPVSSAQDEIVIGDRVDGELSETGERDRYRFEAQPGDVVVISLVSDDFDSFLTLQTAAGELLQTDDDGGGNRDSLIAGYEIEDAGDYEIIVASFNDVGAGEYSLSLQLMDVPSLSYGDSVSAEGSRSVPLARYQFEGESGDLISLDLQLTGEQISGGYIELRAPSGIAAGSSIYLDERSSRLGPVELDEDGIYTVTVRTASAFMLALDRPQVQAIGVDETVSTRLEAGESLYFELVPEADQLLDFELTSADGLLTRLDVIQPVAIAYTDLALDASGALIDSTLVREGQTYFVVITSADPQEPVVGDVTLSIRPTPAYALAVDAPLSLTFSAETPQHYIEFPAAENERLRLSFVLEGELAASTQSYIVVTQNGAPVASLTPSGVLGVSMEFVTPQVGTARVLVQIYGNTMMTVSLERLSQN